MADLHTPVVNDFGGAPVAEHDYACPVCWERKAILALIQASSNHVSICREAGWELRRRRWQPGRFSWKERR